MQTLEEIAKGIRKSALLTVAMAAKAGDPGDLAEACDFAEADILAALRAERERCAEEALQWGHRSGHIIKAAEVAHAIRNQP